MQKRSLVAKAVSPTESLSAPRHAGSDQTASFARKSWASDPHFDHMVRCMEMGFVHPRPDIDAVTGVIANAIGGQTLGGTPAAAPWTGTRF